MRVHVNVREDPALKLELSRDEVALFRAALERASFMDTRPELQAVVYDFVQRLLQQLPDEHDAPPAPPPR
jgi:hypothetical protein